MSNGLVSGLRKFLVISKLFQIFLNSVQWFRRVGLDQDPHRRPDSAAFLWERGRFARGCFLFFFSFSFFLHRIQEKIRCLHAVIFRVSRIFWEYKWEYKYYICVCVCMTLACIIYEYSYVYSYRYNSVVCGWNEVYVMGLYIGYFMNATVLWFSRCVTFI